MAQRNLVPVPKVLVPAATEEEIEDMSLDERRAEVFLLYATGLSQAAIARRYGLTQATISKDLAVETQRRRSRAENIEAEIERIAGVYERVMVKSWERHEEAANANINSVAGTTYLKTTMEAAEKYAQIRGLMDRDGTKKKDGPTRVVVRIGGSEVAPQIDVGVESA